MRDVCVIGAGIVGASVAFHLSRLEAHRVTLVDVGYVGAGTTEAGTGWIAARDGADAQYRELKLLGMEEHHRLAGWFPSSPWLTTGGTLQTEDSTADFDGLIEGLKLINYPVEILTAARVNETMERFVSFDRPDLRVAHFPNEFTVAGSLLARTLFQAAVDNGVIGHFGSRVVGLEQLPGGRHRIALEDGTPLEADVVVNTAGAKADEVAGFYGIPMPMRPQPGISIQVRAEGNILGRMIHVKGLVVKPETNGVLRLRSLLGWRTGLEDSERNVSFTGGLSPQEFAARVVEQAEQLLPSIAPIRPIATITGVRPIPGDGLPRIGEVASMPGYFEAVMHSGGNLAPLVGRLLAEEIATGEKSPVLAPYRPGRFLDRPGKPGQGLAFDSIHSKGASV